MIRVAALLALLITSPAVAQSFQDTKLLDKAVEAFTDRGIGDDGGARTIVDSRLKLAACPMISLAWRTESHDAVVVTCPAPEWRIYVPVRMGGPALTPPSPGAPAAAPRSAAPVLKPALVIKRGDPVAIVAGTEGFSVTRDGIAASDAAAGSRVLIKVQEGKAPIQAIAVEPGKAVIPGDE